MIKAGLEDIVAAESAICDVNGKEGRLITRVTTFTIWQNIRHSKKLSIYCGTGAYR